MLIADRYRLTRLAGTGGMGSVYRASDLHSGQAVAVKLAQHLSDHSHARRFIREAQVLAELHHPHIVRYIDHGVTMTGAPFLVMEWLDGEDLAEVLKREPLTEAQTIALGRSVCSALTAAHARGIIHRDLKPGNLFLVGGGADQVKLIDFGVVRRQVAMSMPTKPGMLIGTPGFIAPEQARGDASIDQRVDLYSLGAVMFACLTARPPFEGHQLMAVLAKLLIERAPRVTEVRRDVSVALDELIARLLAKHPGDRPATASEVMTLLEQVQDAGGQPPPVRARSSGPLSHREQRVFSVLLLGDTARPTNPQARKNLASLAETFEADLQQLMDGSVMAVFSTDDEPGEMATRAARCALAFHGRSPGAPIVVATGRGLIEERLPVGRVIDDAVSLLFAFDETYDLDTPLPVNDAPEIVIDDATAALIERRFELQRSPQGRGYVLIGEAAALSGARKLLGKETRLVGRERELGRLEAVFEQAVIEMVPRVVQIEGEAGAGKSRLAHEFIKGLRESGRQLAIWSAHGDSIRQESPLGMLAALLRQAMQIPATASLTAQRERIRFCVAERVAPESLHRVAAFVGEIMGVRFPDNDNVQLHEARRDPGIMRDLMQRAWEDYLAAEADGWPVILVLEDVQWSDRASLRFIDMALRNLEGRAVLVLAMVLPEGRERFPALWAGHPAEHITLGPLTQRACLELARQVLPEPAGSELLTTLAERCGGNPFYLEELLRVTADKPSDELPDAILVMVSARLRALSAAERRALRAASVFGTDFWIGGVAALLDDDPAEVSAIMNHLCDRELVSHHHSRLEGQAQYGFRHDLFRDASYASLTDEDRVQAHRGAGEWLEDTGESDAAILAEHYWRGKAFASALPWYQRAAEHALGAEDLDAVLHLAQRAVDCGAGGDVLGALQALQAEAHNWLMEPERAAKLGIEAMKRLAAGSDAWAGAGHQVIWAASSLGDSERMVQIARQLIEHVPERPSDEYLASLAYPALHLRTRMRDSESRVMVGVLRAHLRPRKAGPLLAATLAHMNGLLLAMEGKLDLAVTVMKLSVELWTELGSLRHVCLDQGNLGEILCALGRYQDGIDELWRSVARSRRADFTAVRSSYEGALALALARTGALDEARRLFDELPGAGRGRSQDIFQRLCRAQFELLAGQPDRANRHISAVLEQLAGAVSPHQHALARAVAAQALLALGRPAQALDEARAGLAAIGAITGFSGGFTGGFAGAGEVPVRLAYVEALHASGHEPEARGAVVEARRRLLERAELIANLEMRQSFLDRVAENRRTLELAAAWHGEAVNAAK